MSLTLAAATLLIAEVTGLPVALQSYDQWREATAVVLPVDGAFQVAARPDAPVLVESHDISMLGQQFGGDWYGRLHVVPLQLSLGNVVSTQVRFVYVWNAYLDQSLTLVDEQLTGGDGITMTSPGSVPLNFGPLQERIWELSISTSGPPIVSAALTFTFTGFDPITVSITGARLQAWPLPADWGSDIVEELVWLTELQRAVNGSQDRIPLRDAPRRTWEFDAVADRRERRIVENALYDWSARTWALPVWPDISLLGSALPPGSTSIALDTAGLDYRVDGLVMLWSDVQRYELAEVSAVASGALSLARPTLNAWPAGTRVYPCRTARLTDPPQLRRKSDQVFTSRIRFEAMEPCDWPPIAPTALHQGIPVLEQRPDESGDPNATFGRWVEVIDGDTGIVALDDISGLAWPEQTHAWFLAGRSARAAHRSLLYWLQGRAQALWVPTWADDLQLVATTGPTASALTVAWASISVLLRAQPGRRHIRIELNNGSVFYRRVPGVTEIDADTEQVQIDPPLGVTVEPHQVRQISWMTLMHAQSDRAQISHVTDSEGLARSRLGFVSAGIEEPA